MANFPGCSYPECGFPSCGYPNCPGFTETGIDYALINDSIRALVSQAVSDGFLMGKTGKQADNEALNARREELLGLIQSEVEADKLLEPADG